MRKGKVTCKGAGCRSFAGHDGYCKNCRQKRLNPNPKRVRDNYKEYGGYFGKDEFYGSNYGMVKDRYDVEEGY